jgi:glycosyltransferase involved in cell wall biosynthesis
MVLQIERGRFQPFLGLWCRIMKFLHIIGSMDPRTGGPCQVVRNFAPLFGEKSNSLEVLCFDDPNCDFLSEDPFRIHTLGPGRGSWNYHPQLLPWLDQNLPGFDVAIVHGLWQYPGYALSKVTRRPNMPSRLVFAHGMLDPWFQRLTVRPMKALRNWMYWKLVEHQVVNQADALLFTCAEEQRLAQCTFRPYRPKKEAIVVPGTSEPPAYHCRMKAAFAKTCPGLGEDRYFLFLGRIASKKGVGLLIKAYAAYFSSTAAKRHAAIPKLVIAGPGLETGFGRRMEELAGKLCPPNSVFWPGMLSGDAKWGALWNSEAFVLSSHQENFGIAVVEALSCGKPVLISKKINIWREIEADRAGLAADDTLQGTESLFRCWGSLSTTDLFSMKQAAKASYENRFHISLTAQSLKLVARDVTKRGHSGKGALKAPHPLPTVSE